MQRYLVPAASDSWEQHQELSLQDNVEGTALDISPGALQWTVTPLHSHQGVKGRLGSQGHTTLMTVLRVSFMPAILKAVCSQQPFNTDTST